MSNKSIEAIIAEYKIEDGYAAILRGWGDLYSDAEVTACSREESDKLIAESKAGLVVNYALPSPPMRGTE